MVSLRMSPIFACCFATLIRCLLRLCEPLTLRERRRCFSFNRFSAFTSGRGFSSLSPLLQTARVLMPTSIPTSAVVSGNDCTSVSTKILMKYPVGFVFTNRCADQFRIIRQWATPADLQRFILFGQRDLSRSEGEGIGLIANGLFVFATLEFRIARSFSEEVTKGCIEVSQRLL